jgi:hypothetical protein
MLIKGSNPTISLLLRLRKHHQSLLLISNPPFFEPAAFYLKSKIHPLHLNDHPLENLLLKKEEEEEDPQ